MFLGRFLVVMNGLCIKFGIDASTSKCPKKLPFFSLSQRVRGNALGGVVNFLLKIRSAYCIGVESAVFSSVLIMLGERK